MGKNRVGNFHTPIYSNQWHDVVEFRSPDLGYGFAGEPYIYMKCKRETVAALCFDPYSRMLAMRVEGTLQSNFVPAYKLMSETMEDEDAGSPAAALKRGLKEEFGWEYADENEFVVSHYFFRTITGTYNEMHNYYCSAVVMPGFYERWAAGQAEFDGDGSTGEDRSAIGFISLSQTNLVNDWLFYVVLGLHYAELANSPQYREFCMLSGIHE